VAKLKISDSHYMYLNYVFDNEHRNFEGYENLFEITLPSILLGGNYPKIYFYCNNDFNDIRNLIKWLEDVIFNKFNVSKKAYYIETDDCSDCVDFIIDENNNFNIKLCLDGYYCDTSNYVTLYDINIEDLKKFLEELKEDSKNNYINIKTRFYRSTGSKKTQKDINKLAGKISKKYGKIYDKDNN